MGKDRRRHHAETDAEWPSRWGVVAGRRGLPQPLIRRRKGAAAVLGRPGDPAEAGVEEGLSPCLRFFDLGQLLLAGLLGEQTDLVAALAPRQVVVWADLGVRLQEGQRLGFKGGF